MGVGLRKRTEADLLQDIVNRFREEVHAGALDLSDVAHWALRKKLWEPSRQTAAKQLKQKLARALQQEYYTDPQGRRVRKKHAYRIKKDEKQMVLWVDIDDAIPQEMRLAFQQRRGSILGDCKQLRTDVDSFNDNNVHGAQIEFSFNFEEDLEELSMPAEYPARKPEQKDRR